MVAVLSLAVTFFVSAIAANAQSVPGSIPITCSSNCQTLIDKFGSTDSATKCKADLNCSCTNDLARGMRSCYQCAVDAKTMTQQDADKAVSAYVDGCKAAGRTISNASSLKMSGFGAVVALSGLALL